jgi:predicted metalloendopeptidase
MGRLVAIACAYRQSITDSDWMTPQTRTAALEKLAKFEPHIGYPDQWRDYRSLVITQGDLVGNVMRAQSFEHDFQTAKLGKSVDRGEWPLTPQTVNAGYIPRMNQIVFPAAILQPPIFTADADDAVNYGAIGSIIGHEVGHGFDDQGRKFDGSGALHDWWTADDDREFKRRATCSVEQFNAFSPIPGMHVNGELTLGENIGDLSGLSIAYKAYKISLGAKPLRYRRTHRRSALFLGYGTIWRARREMKYAGDC